MNTINNITTDPTQKMTIVLADGSSVVFTIYFCLQQLGWFIKSLTYANTNFTLNSLRITTNPNFLRQFKNLIPFGLACFTKDNGEPKLQQDFSSGYAVLSILTAEEVRQYEELLSGQTPA